MARQINQCVIEGNLTRDAELRVTSGGTKVLTWTVANNDQRMDSQSGRWEDVTNYVGCVLFGARAEGLAPHMTKGRRVTVSGRLRYRSWDKDGERRSALEVHAQEISLMGRAEPAQDTYDEDVPF